MTLKLIQNDNPLPHFEKFYLVSSKGNDSFLSERRLGANAYINYLNNEKSLKLMKSLKYEVNKNPSQTLPNLLDLKINFKRANSIVFLNGVLSPELSNYDKQNLEISNIFQPCNFEASIFASLNVSYLTSPVNIVIINKLKLPVHIIHINTLTKPEMVFGYIGITVANKVKTQIIESFIDTSTVDSLYNRILAINISNMAEVKYKANYQMKKSSLCLYNQFDLQNNSKMQVSTKIKKLKNVFHDEQINLSQFANFENKSILQNLKEYVYKFVINHSSNSVSNTLLKCYCKSNENIEITGDLSVAENQGRIEAYQKFASINLGKNSKIKFTPLLHIASEDVSVNHGTSITQLEQKDITYLNSKGISQRDAKKLLIKSFLKL